VNVTARTKLVQLQPRTALCVLVLSRAEKPTQQTIRTQATIAAADETSENCVHVPRMSQRCRWDEVKPNSARCVACKREPP